MITTVSTSFIKRLLEIQPTIENRKALGRLRRRWGISFETLAEVSGYAAGTIKQYEMYYGNRRGPSQAMMQAWFEALTILIAEQRAFSKRSAETV